VALARGTYRGFNDHHLTEKLTEAEGIPVSRETVRQLLRREGLASPRKRRPPRHRARRTRRPTEGMLLQVDGSPHDWLEGRGPTLTLVGAIDDATAQVPGACFVDHQTTGAYVQPFLAIFAKKGLPQAIYADRHSIFWTDREPTREEQLAGRRPRTQVGRALDELGITLIPAGSPQTKGRVERLWRGPSRTGSSVVAAGGRHDPRGGPGGAGLLPAPLQPALRETGGGDTRVARGGASPLGTQPVLHVPAGRGQGQHRGVSWRCPAPS
jgi:hypothetical protein